MTTKGFLKYLFSVLLFVPFVAEAATQGTVTLTGKVPQACNIIVTTEAGATNIADISQAATDVLIATVNESCNDPQGYTVSVAGTHSGDHTGVFREPGGDEHPFTLKYGGVAVSAATVTDVNTPGINLNKQVRISYGTDATAYMYRSLRIDTRSMPRDYDAGADSFTFLPAYKNGSILKIGSAANILADGYLKGPDGKVISYQGGELQHLNNAEDKPVEFFTNSEGRFRVSRLTPGKYKIRMQGFPDLGAVLSVPEIPAGRFDAGTIMLEKK